MVSYLASVAAGAAGVAGVASVGVSTAPVCLAVFSSIVMFLSQDYYAPTRKQLSITVIVGNVQPARFRFSAAGRHFLLYLRHGKFFTGLF